MSHEKSIDRLSATPASVGGAMATWPLRTLWWTCRTERTSQTVPQAVSALLDKDTDDLADLADLAERVGMDPSGIEESRRTLDSADPEAVARVVNDLYSAVYGSDAFGTDLASDLSRPESMCPYEKEGSDMACHRCPVAGAAMKELKTREGER